jgi:1,2-diacylglycerol 3-alpha-glucosyltransferase
VEQQALRFAREGNNVSIFTLKANIVPSPNIKLHVLGMPNNLLLQRIYRLFFPFDFIKAIRWVPQLRGFDCIYSHQYPMNWLAYLTKRRYGIQYIYYNHGYPPLKTFPNLVEHTYMKLITIFANWTIKRADKAISVSQYLRQELKRESGLDSDVIYNEIDTRRFHPGIDRTQIRQRYNLGDTPLVLFVGRISPQKGIHLLIQAFSLIRRQVPEVRLLIAGKHTIRNYSRKLSEMVDTSVIFAEDVSDEDLPHYYAACDVYATATLWEGFDLPVAEAQACGKPVVAFNIGPHPEVIKVGAVGKLVPVGDTKAMAEAIVGFLKTKSRGET